MAVDLREYQNELVSAAYRHFNAGRRRVLIQSPVGSGKTRTAARIVSDAISRDRRVLFLAHRKELITQPRDTFSAFGMKAGIIKAGFNFEPDLSLQIGSVQTLANRLDTIQVPDLIVVDEAHHSIAGQWDAILSAFPSARVVGLSGTPERLDGAGLDETFEIMVDGPQIPWLIEQGFLVDCDVYGARDRIEVPRPRPGSDYDYKAVLRALERKGRDGDPLVQARLHLTGNRRGVGFGPTVEYCEAQAERFRGAGFNAFCLSGSTPDAERDAILAGYANGETQFVWNVDVIGEGTDIPSLEVLIDCAKTKSLVRYIQRAGRILRPAPGKDRGIYIDLVGNVVEHGHPCIDRTWSLAGEGGRRRQAETTTEGEHISTRQCRSCYQHFRTAPTCPYCGEEQGWDARVSIERAAEIVKQEKSDLERARQEAARARKAEEAACRSLQELQALGTRRGYKPGWAFSKWKARKDKHARLSVPPANDIQARFDLEGWPT